MIEALAIPHAATRALGRDGRPDALEPLPAADHGWRSPTIRRRGTPGKPARQISPGVVLASCDPTHPRPGSGRAPARHIPKADGVAPARLSATDSGHGRPATATVVRHARVAFRRFVCESCRSSGGATSLTASHSR
ncbi:hypothetical protein SAOR_12440 [Salinisphaera orenii MK-B5]|uniref:Uncharacterized protein n=1 Tax=Salinisphaera orenii MK-B5 TaxID=856730 RepID=A0A423PIQ9_9GAMM|nr:hypothetical protein [Salinisphaera orenii]ROO25456.1 hypothetical protein SAOR_12440 [Salinisphaera orenii MK-B5]